MQGKTINGFTLQRLLGTGGMAEVWYAENKIGKKAAVKLLLPKFCADEVVKERFHTEAKVMVALNHSNIRQVYDYGELEGRPTIVMEYLDGSDLKTRMKQGQRFTQEELVKWWNQMVDALNYTHGQDIVHRDIKPSNIFVDAEGNAKLLDFGIAKVRDSISATQTGQKLGTLMYMSPEQVRDPKRVGAASDAYSLAVTFVHLLTGKAPYDSTTDSDYDIQESIVRKPLDLSAVPKAWHGFLDSYLEKDPAQRPALQHYALPPEAPEPDNDGETEVGGAPPPPEPEPKPNPNPKKALWIGLGVAALVALMLLIFWPKKTTDSTDPETQAYEACETVEDYRAYMHDYGDSALHYADAQAFVERWVADSIALADSMAKAEAELTEDEAYKNCTTVADCEEYLKTYPEGRYMEEVKAEKAELEAKAVQIGVSGSANGHDYVDLGLPSGTLWATCNIGASEPEEYGNYYAWGETQTKSKYVWESYRYYARGTLFDHSRLTKYCSDSRFGNNGFTDNLIELLTGDDAATANWGSGWRTPSKEQCDELLANTTNHWTTRNGVKGRHFISKKNGATLFLPAAGYYHVSDLKYEGVEGNYWLRSLSDYQYNGWCFLFGSNYCEVDRNHDRCYGFCVRPVREKPRPMNEETENPSKSGNSQMDDRGGAAGGKESSSISNTNVRTSGSANGHEWVDLGLPSGTLWATCNVGASNPEDYGSYFAWGETSTKSTYNWDTYKYANGDDDKMTKYCSRSAYGNNGFTDNLTTLQGSDDAATAKWGSGWRTPSMDQWEELLKNTTHQYTTKNGVKGHLFTSTKNVQSVFLPAAGGCWGSKFYIIRGYYGYYWSRLLGTDGPNRALSLSFGSGNCIMDHSARSLGFPVRPVREK